MSVRTVTAYDCIGANVDRLPPHSQVAGYTTGSGPVPWSAAQIAAHPGMVLIDQTPTPGAWDALADVQDVESGAVTVAEVPGRAKAMAAAFAAGARPGQREPCIYVGAPGNATPVVNALLAAGIGGGVNLAEAIPGRPPADAQAMIDSTAGTPFPVVWVQYAFDVNNAYDAGLMSVPWLSNVSAAPVPPVTGETMILDMLKTNGPAVAVAVPAHMTKVVLSADAGLANSVQPVIRVGTSPHWNGGPHVEPKWGAPAVVALPSGTTEVTFARIDTGDVPVSADFS